MNIRDITPSQMNALVAKASANKFTSLEQVNALNSGSDYPVEMNEIFINLFNLIGRQFITNSLRKTKWISLLTEKGADLETGSFELFIENLPRKLGDYDKDTFIPNERKDLQQVQFSITTREKKISELTLTQSVIAGAFLGISQMTQLIAEQLEWIEKSLELHFYNVIQEDIIKSIHTTLTGVNIEGSNQTNYNDFSPVQENMIQFLIKIKEMIEYPSREFNLDGRGRVIANSSASDIKIMANIKTMSSFRAFATAKLFKDKYFDIDMIPANNMIHLPKMRDGEIIVMDKNGYRFFTRVNKLVNQFFAANNTTYWVHHFWANFNAIPWKNAFKFVINDITDKNTDYLIGVQKGTAKSADGSTITGINYELACPANISSNYNTTDEDWIQLRVMVAKQDPLDPDNIQKGDILGTKIFNKAASNTGALPYDMENAMIGEFGTISYEKLADVFSLTSAGDALLGDTGTIPITKLANGNYQVYTEIYGYLKGVPVATSSQLQSITVPAPSATQNKAKK